MKKKNCGIRCRFGFPRPPMKKTLIIQPLPCDLNQNIKNKLKDTYKTIQEKLINYGRSFKEDIPLEQFLQSMNISEPEYILSCRSSIKRTTVFFFLRSTNAIFINDYNKRLLQAWRANMDIQFILDTYACAKYCVG